MKLKIYTLTSDTDNGMETTLYAAQAELKRDLEDLVRSTDEERADEMDLIESMDSDDWDSLWQEWRDDQIGDDCIYNWDSHALDIPVPPIENLLRAVSTLLDSPCCIKVLPDSPDMAACLAVEKALAEYEEAFKA